MLNCKLQNGITITNRNQYKEAGCPARTAPLPTALPQTLAVNEMIESIPISLKQLSLY